MLPSIKMQNKTNTKCDIIIIMTVFQILHTPSLANGLVIVHVSTGNSGATSQAALLANIYRL